MPLLGTQNNIKKLNKNHVIELIDYDNESMKIFYITIDFTLAEKPEWLSDFRQKYDDEYEPEFHITIKQATNFNKEDEIRLNQVLTETIIQFAPMTIEFDKLSYSSTDNGNVIMIMAKDNSQLNLLQSGLREKLDQFGDVIKSYYRDFETNFEPHITIARHLSDEQLELAKKELGENTPYIATVNTITLHISTKEVEAGIYPDYEKTYYTLT